MGEVTDAFDPTLAPRLAVMEATGSDYQTFKGKVSKFLAGTYDAFVSKVDAMLTPVADQILALQTSLASAPLSIGEFAVANLPSAAANQDKFAYATDLFGSVRDKVASVKIGSTWYWVPTRSYAKTNIPIASMTLVTLASPTTILFNGTLLASQNITLSTTNAYPGASFDIGFDGTISVGGITIAGLLGGITTTLGAGARKSFRYADNNDGTFGWKAY
jgi:hypothetical protein